MRDTLTEVRGWIVRGTRFLLRMVGKWGSRVASGLGLPTERLRRFQRRMYVLVDNLMLRDRLARGEFYRPRDRKRLEGFEDMIEQAFKELDDPGDYAEFGVFFGRSLVHAHRALDRLGLVGQIRCIGFDSFEGMPKEAARESGPWIPGEYRSDREFAMSYIAQHGVDLSHVHLVKGWFSDTLNDETARSLDLKHIGVAMIDCDIYSATKLALEFCAPRLGDTSFLFFDDWSADGVEEDEGQQRAFREFLECHRDLSTVHVGSYSSDSAVFKVRRETAQLGGNQSSA